MSRRNGNGPKLDLKLNLSSPRAMNHHNHHHHHHQNYIDQHPIRMQESSPNRSMTSSPTNSCVSSDESPGRQRHVNSPETATTSMVLVGCPRCLMYVMLAEADSRCPKCKSTCLLDVIYESNNTRKR
ncbi:hypothetical protein K7X08_007838 [Anisodus acutangulus]|uniref:GIR1-like zinc ribbon domain-containing protein n=1 Tax=Anisodus acutangulus TaxID=402998 RepID=A0A9Q1MP78_9SOLA|nr:hypothetical protein K7X08_007838 [Anisodus acutangulus]